MRCPEYYRAEAEIASDQLGLDLSDEQLNELAEIMDNAADMESYATGNWVICNHFSEPDGHKDRQEALQLLRELAIHYVVEERVHDGDGNWVFEHPDRATKILCKLQDYITHGRM